MGRVRSLLRQSLGQDPFRISKGSRVEQAARRVCEARGVFFDGWLALHDKKASDDAFTRFLPIIKRESTDERNFVKKAVNWALRQIGKRNRILNQKAIETAHEIQKLNSKSAKWIAADALRELTNEKVQSRINSENL